MSVAFHLAFRVADLSTTRDFYVNVLGCREGRRTERWMDFDFFGHQLSAHLLSSEGIGSSIMDGHEIPIPHFGAILAWDEFHRLADRIRRSGKNSFVEPATRFDGQTGEQVTMFLRDPSGNAIEFKAFRDPAQVFATG